MTVTDPFPGPRSERRRESESRILQAACEVFAKEGYDRATIRAVAGRAGVDPALVMHYFGCKEQLFDMACHADVEEIAPGRDEDLAERVLLRLGEKLRQEPASEQALLRSMLTHDQAAEAIRCAIAAGLGRVLDRAMGGEEAHLRTGLLMATAIGVLVGRYLLELDGLRDASPEEIMDLLRPCFRSLVMGGELGEPGQPIGGATRPSNRKGRRR
ncbi:MAG: TetR/AcrR family transcriptional regulator [Acidimicrobiales bacterium]